MSQFPHDDFAKAYLSELLSPIGTVEVEHRIKAEARSADIWFTPGNVPGSAHQALGLLGTLVAQPYLLEHFRNPAGRSEIRRCLAKLFSLHAKLERQANQTLPEADLPMLWILVPSASVELRRGFGAIRRQPNVAGLYALPAYHRTGIVVLNQLTQTPDTLWLRVLSRGRVQQQAIAELAALSDADPLRETIAELLADYRAVLEQRLELSQEQEELLVNLSPVYRQKQEEWKQQGLEQGSRAERTATIANLLRARFSPVDEALTQIIPNLTQLSGEEFAAAILQIAQLSREDLMARFGESSQSH